MPHPGGARGRHGPPSRRPRWVTLLRSGYHEPMAYDPERDGATGPTAASPPASECVIGIYGEWIPINTISMVDPEPINLNGRGATDQKEHRYPGGNPADRADWSLFVKAGGADQYLGFWTTREQAIAFRDAHWRRPAEAEEEDRRVDEVWARHDAGS